MDPKGHNSFFFVGDQNQKVFAKQHAPTLAGFNFRGRSQILAQNYRNTQEILRAVLRLPEKYPPKKDEEIEIISPELSQFKGGGRPIVLACLRESHTTHVLDLVQKRSGPRIAVVSENDVFLGEFKVLAKVRGLCCYDLFRVEDLDLGIRNRAGA